jgi:hypothetical protein
MDDQPDQADAQELVQPLGNRQAETVEPVEGCIDKCHQRITWPAPHRRLSNWIATP